MALSDRFSEAVAYACQLHGEQTRKASGVPYVAHLLSVTALALEHGASEDEAIAALLHDAIEDQGGARTREEIGRRFGPAVGAIVEGCTDADTIPKPPWRERKEKYLANLVASNASIHLVCACDKLHNARSLVEDYRACGERLWDRFSGGKAGTLWYYREVTTILNQLKATPLTRALDRTVTELESLVEASKNE